MARKSLPQPFGHDYDAFGSDPEAGAYQRYQDHTQHHSWRQDYSDDEPSVEFSNDQSEHNQYTAAAQAVLDGDGQADTEAGQGLASEDDPRLAAHYHDSSRYTAAGHQDDFDYDDQDEGRQQQNRCYDEETNTYYYSNLDEYGHPLVHQGAQVESTQPANKEQQSPGAATVKRPMPASATTTFDTTIPPAKKTKLG